MSYLHGNSVSVRQSISQFWRELTLPRFLAYLSMAKPSTFSKVHARSQVGAFFRHTFCVYSVNTGNWDAVRPPGMYGSNWVNPTNAWIAQFIFQINIDYFQVLI